MSGDMNFIEMDQASDIKLEDQLLECFELEEMRMVLSEIVNSINDCEIKHLREKLFQEKVITLQQMDDIEDDTIKKNVSDFIQRIDSKTDMLSKVLIEFSCNFDNGQTVKDILAKKKAQSERSSDEKNVANTTENDSASSQVASDDKNITIKEKSDKYDTKYDWFVKDPSLKEMPVTQSDASKFPACFGSAWQDIMIEFGFTKNNIELARENDGYNPHKTITSLIIKWIQRNGRNATMDRFLTILKDTEKHEIEWGILEQIVIKKKLN
ncbi:uncharacterized protein LOC129923963 isoform X2 [Biomphalaria glabrata]|uniref:Uncharacterized protein LOC129923963 isoform X2 n=1 Tax=Biomphalaria glabrata TaxID=6526 RepID=A0A9W2ZE32_BIOGL|nr:uncharacterized protein LOC129923963 isoform X2 [Biomphalaria glabrata]